MPYSYAYDSVYDEVKYLRQYNDSANRQINELMKENQELRHQHGLDAYKAQCESEASRIYADMSAKYGRLQDVAREYEKNLEQSRQKVEELTLKLQNARQEQKQNLSMIRTLEGKLAAAEQDLKKLEKDHQELTEKLRSEQEKHAEDDKTIELLRKQCAALGVKIEKIEKEKDKLVMQKNKDSTNSSMPTSSKPNSGRVPNSRTPTEKNPGGQPNHQPAPRKTVMLPSFGRVTLIGMTDPLWENKDYIFDGFTVKHIYSTVTAVVDQVVFLPQFRNIYNNAHKNADWPESLKDEVNYSPELKAALYLLNNGMYASTRSSGEFIKELTEHNIDVSKGFISKLSEEFAMKSEPERAMVYTKLLGAHVMNVDQTFVNVGGRQYYVTICISGGNTLYFFKARKGKSGVKDTPIEHTCAILVHDHDVVYYNYGYGHQECLAHVIRYLVSSIENEPNLTWSMKMHTFIQKMIHDSNEADMRKEEARQNATDDNDCGNAGNESSETLQLDSEYVHARFDEKMIQEYKEEFLRTCELGLAEYQQNSPKSWFPDGLNLCTRLKEHPEYYLHFLEDEQIPATNGVAESAAREFKRKLHACGEFRGFLGVIAYCEGISVIDSLRSSNTPILPKLSEIFRREIYTEDRLRLQKALKGILEEIIESDCRILERDEKDLASAQAALQNAQKSRTESEEQFNSYKASHPEIHVSEKPDAFGKYASDEKADRLKRKFAYEERTEYLLKNAVDENREKLEFDLKHKERCERKLQQALDRINSYNEKIEKETKERKANKNDTGTSNTSAALVLTPEQQDKVRDATNIQAQKIAELTDVSNKLSLAYSDYYITYTMPGIIEGKRNSDTGKAKAVVVNSYTEEEKERALNKIHELQAAVDNVLEEVTVASRTLDQLRKNIVRRSYKKRVSKKEAETDSSVPA